MNDRTNGILNTAFIRTHRCATCWGVLVERCIDSAWQVVCPKGCQPGGFVTEAWVEQQKAKSHTEAEEVKNNYPQLADKPLDANERQRIKTALYGEGD